MDLSHFITVKNPTIQRKDNLPMGLSFFLTPMKEIAGIIHKLLQR